MPPVITIRDIGKKYRIATPHSYLSLRDVVQKKMRRIFSQRSSSEAFWALRGINLDIEAGERLGIIGHNGAGKSTLLKIISRITPPTTGRITITGRAASLLEVGTGFHPELTGRENIYFNGSVLGLKRAEIRQRFDEIVAFSGVEAFIETPLKHYSTGMQLRLAFSVASHLEAEVLLIDEVLAVGDIAFQKKCIGKMEEISKLEGRTILFVSHNIGFIQNFCTKAVLLSQGKIEAYGTVQQVIDTYIQKNTAGGRFKNIFGNRQVELLKFDITNGSIATNQLLLGYPATFNISFKAFTDLNGIEVAFNIKNLYTEIITHITSIDKQIHLSVRKDQEVHIAIQLNSIDFTPSTYKIDCFILNNNEMCWGCYDFEEIVVMNSDKALRPSGFPPHVKTFTDTIWKIA